MEHHRDTLVGSLGYHSRCLGHYIASRLSGPWYARAGTCQPWDTRSSTTSLAPQEVTHLPGNPALTKRPAQLVEADDSAEAKAEHHQVLGCAGGLLATVLSPSPVLEGVDRAFR